MLICVGFEICLNEWRQLKFSAQTRKAPLNKKIYLPFASAVNGSRWLGAGILLTALAGLAAEPAKIDFSRDVRPLLAGHCFKCHGQDEAARKAQLRLDVRADALKPAKSDEVAIVPGKPDKSELVRRIFVTDEDELMPPPAAKKPLTPEEKDLLKRWIAAGAEYQDHWAFAAPKQAPPPSVQDKAWVKNAIDNFILARLEREGLKPSSRADKYTLVRRLYLDLTGLPPTPEEADVFVKDSSPQAYEKLVDTLLASPHYGERWARRWLDLARYADTNGYEKDRQRSIWPWRDWVINALNADMPFDKFTIEQLAGDLLPNATTDDIVATGLHRNSMLNEEGGIDALEYRFYSMVDRVHVTSTAWLGLTMACAQCHTHKFDPIQHTEYYGFMAFLNNADEPVYAIREPGIVAQREKIQKQIDALTAALPDQFPAENRFTWQPSGAAEFSATNGATAARLADGSFRLTGKTPDNDTYTLQFPAAPERITHLQIEVFPAANPKGGAGKGKNAGFLLSEVELLVASNGVAEKIDLSLAKAGAEAGDTDAEKAIDDNLKTGWSGNGKKTQTAVFALATPLELSSATNVTVRLVQTDGAHRPLGHFRVSLGRELAEVKLSEARRRELRDASCVEWLAAQLPAVAAWQTLRPVSAVASNPILTIQSDDSVFASGDFTKSDTYTLKFRKLPPGVTALRLEMLPDDRLPHGGPGAVNHEGPEGDFFLSTLKAKADGQAMTFTNATESFSNGKNIAANAIDADAQTGWTINGGQGKAHNAVFQFTAPVTATNELELEFLCEKYYAAGLGRFRVWVTTDENARASKLENEALTALVKHRSKDKLKSLFTATKAAPERALLLREFTRLAPDYAKAREPIEKLRQQMPAFPTTLVMQERPPGHERPTFRQHRGEFLQPKEIVTPGIPAFLPPLPPDAPKNRLGLAKWLVSGANPLTGRVLMNRQWEALFGRGLVRTTEDFGFQGDLPSHPELLDWLAVEFVKQGWSQKKMLKLLVMSATYQQASDTSPELRERDPQNILLARGPRFRVEAEMVRDAALVASGLFADKLGGPSVFPPQPAGVTSGSEGAYGPLDWKTSTGADRYRRGLYTFAKRTTPFAMTAAFDAPSGEACLARRERSNSPLQALTTLNDAAFMECARALGQLAAKSTGDDAARVELIFRRCLTRPPSAVEREKLVQFFQAQLARFQSGELKAAELLETSASATANVQAAWTTVARVLLNLDETITKS